MTPSGEQDIAIIKSVLSGNTAAYSKLVDKYGSYVMSLTVRYINDRQKAEELAQDVFIKAWHNLPGWRGEAKFSTWLFTIVHTTCLSYLRKKKNVSIPVEESVMKNIIHSSVKNEGLPKLDNDHRKAAMNSALEQLEESDAQVLSLFYMGEQKIDEIAIITGLSVSNVKVRLFRARQKLKVIIEKQYNDSLLQ